MFSTVVLCFIAMISLFSFLLLVETRQAVPGSFGGASSSPLLILQAAETDSVLTLADIGGKLYGKWMRWAILTAIVTSQVRVVLPLLLEHECRFAADGSRARLLLTYILVLVCRSASSRPTPSLSCVARPAPLELALDVH